MHAIWDAVWGAIKANPFSVFTAGSFLVALFVAVYFTWWRQRKAFGYRIVSDYSLVNVEKEYREKVKVFYEDRPVKRVNLLVVELKNLGWQSIEDKDISGIIAVQLGPGSKIIGDEIVKCNPEDLNPKYNVKAESVEFDPLLLNRKDFIRIKLLVADYDGFRGVRARIKSVPKIREYTSDTIMPSVTAFLTTVFMTIMMYLAIRTGATSGIDILTSPYVKLGFLISFPLILYHFYRLRIGIGKDS